jgi:hypothetical protein
MQAALVTPFLGHLPLHPSSYLGYAIAIIGQKYEVDVIDINAAVYYQNKDKLEKILVDIEHDEIVFDDISFYHFYLKLSGDVAEICGSISWGEYQSVYITAPTWFVTVPTEIVLKLSNSIKNKSPDVKIHFIGNSLGSWTDEKGLTENGIHIVHLNDPFQSGAVNEPVDYDSLPTPIYRNRDRYLFDILPFRLKHGCIWGKCRFCSLAKGWNAGYKERSAERVIQEMGELVDKYNPTMFVCRDNSLNGWNLTEFCTYFENFKKPWAGMARANLTDKEIEALHRAGCRLIYFGIESGSDRTLKEINKGISSRQMSDFIKALHHNNIMPAPSFFVGTPGETEDDIQKTIQFIMDHKDYIDALNLYPLMITPASDFSIQQTVSSRDALISLDKLIRVCKDVGIKVCVGEQSGEYVFCKKVYPAD